MFKYSSFNNRLFISIACFAWLFFMALTHAENKPPAAPGKALKHGEYKGAQTATHPDWFKESFLDLEEDINDAAQNNKRLVVYFWQEGCPYCSQLWEDNFSQKDIEDTFRKNFEIVAINLWGDREVVSIKGNNYSEKAFAEALNIKYTPTLLFFDEKQKVALQLNGYIPPDDFRLALEYAADRFALEMTQQPAVFEQVMIVLGKQNKSLPQPPAWVEFFLHSHPSLAKRVLVARRWGKLQTG